LIYRFYWGGWIFWNKISKRKSLTSLQEIKLNNLWLVFRLDQRAHDVSTNSSMKPVMQNLADQLNCKLSTFSYVPNKKTEEIREVYSISLTSPMRLLFLIEYLNKYELIGIKCKDFKDWERAFHMIVSKKHLTDANYLKIIKIKENMNSKRQFTNPLTLLSKKNFD
jgi:hypothetical protein